MEISLLLKLKEELNEKFGEGNWKLRKVSRARKSADHPSLTITEELKKLGCKPQNYVVVVSSKSKIEIYKI